MTSLVTTPSDASELGECDLSLTTPLGRGFFDRFDDVRARGGERRQRIPYNTIAVGRALGDDG